MNLLTRVFLVLLRLAIGWHFLFEGWEKIASHHLPPPPANPAVKKAPWTSEKYLLESQGPLAATFREQAGDPHTAALARLPVLKRDDPPRLPQPADADFTAAVNRFLAHCGVGNDRSPRPEFLRLLTAAPGAGFPASVPWQGVVLVGIEPKPDNVQRALVLADFEAARRMAGEWLVSGEREVERTFSKVKETVTEETRQRIRTYQAKLQELRQIEDHGLRAFGGDVWKKNLTALKAEVETLRADLMRDLERPLRDTMDFVIKVRLTDSQRSLAESLPPPPPPTTLRLIDRVTMYGLTAVGVCLIVGLFTRTACVVGAAFLIMFFLAMPSLPWLPASPRAEGHYFFVNKNIIEALALLTLATTASGRWVGLDGLFYWWWPERLQTPPGAGTTQEERAAPSQNVPRPGARPGAMTADPPPHFRH